MVCFTIIGRIVESENRRIVYSVHWGIKEAKKSCQFYDSSNSVILLCHFSAHA